MVHTCNPSTQGRRGGRLLSLRLVQAIKRSCFPTPEAEPVCSSAIEQVPEYSAYFPKSPEELVRHHDSKGFSREEQLEDKLTVNMGNPFLWDLPKRGWLNEN